MCSSTHTNSRLLPVMVYIDSERMGVATLPGTCPPRGMIDMTLPRLHSRRKGLRSIPGNERFYPFIKDGPRLLWVLESRSCYWKLCVRCVLGRQGIRWIRRGCQSLLRDYGWVAGCLGGQFCIRCTAPLLAVSRTTQLMSTQRSQTLVAWFNVFHFKSLLQFFINQVSSL